MAIVIIKIDTGEYPLSVDEKTEIVQFLEDRDYVVESIKSDES